MTAPTKIICAALFCCLCLTTSCRCEYGAGPIRMAKMGPEEWVVDGVKYPVDSTYYLRRDSNTVIYVIEYSPPNKLALYAKDEDTILAVVFPLMRYAYQTGKYRRERFKALRGTTEASVVIGVDLVIRDGDKVQEYQIVREVGEIVSRLRGGPE